MGFKEIYGFQNVAARAGFSLPGRIGADCQPVALHH